MKTLSDVTTVTADTTDDHDTINLGQQGEGIGNRGQRRRGLLYLYLGSHPRR